MLYRLVGPVMLLGAGALAGNGLSESMRASYVNPQYGFRLDAPTFPKAELDSSVIPVMVAGPAENGFAPNVNVMVQKTVTTRDEFAALSRKQFESLKFKVNEEKNLTVSGAEALLLDYEGTMNDRDLRFLALVVVAKEEVFLVTCTATKQRFSKYEKVFRASVESFSLKREP